MSSRAYAHAPAQTRKDMSTQIHKHTKTQRCKRHKRTHLCWPPLSPRLGAQARLAFADAGGLDVAQQILRFGGKEARAFASELVARAESTAVTVSEAGATRVQQAHTIRQRHSKIMASVGIERAYAPWSRQPGYESHNEAMQIAVEQQLAAP